MTKRSIVQKRQQKSLIRKKKKKQALHAEHRQAKAYDSDKSGLPKLSKSLLEFAEPLFGDSKDNDYIESTIGMVVMCWNIGTVEYHKAQEMRAEVTRMFGDDLHVDLPEGMEQQFDLLIAARRSFFSDDPRLVVEFNVSWDMVGEYNLQVKSITLPKNARFNPDDQEHIACGFSSKTRADIADLKTPATEEQAPIIELIERGYKLLHEHQSAFNSNITVICDIWLEAWDKVKVLYQDTNAISDIKAFAGVALPNWCGDLEMRLYDAGIIDPSYFDQRSLYCREFCREFPESGAGFMHNMIRGEAESLLYSGYIEQGEVVFKTLVESFPDDAWSYIGWADMYNGESIDLPVDIEKAKKLYRTPIDRQLKDANVAQERLDDLLEMQAENNRILEHES